jgi:hypothetical protein
LYVIEERECLIDRGSAGRIILHMWMIFNLFNSSK